ncbi:hypothetical protein B4113_2323 [Geobacillus sp. B4113_201601]|nr:hypothetical protein B4113_2323 [Geobacillus sp. B4113_201601]
MSFSDKNSIFACFFERKIGMFRGLLRIECAKKCKNRDFTAENGIIYDKNAMGGKGGCVEA